MPLRELRAIYEVLFRDGVMVAKKDKRPQAKHAEVEGVSNLQVIRAMGSLKSRGYVKETFAWRHFYWYLTNEGIVYLRDFLRLPPEIVPASLQRIRKPAATLSVAHRAARVQSVEGPTSYVPKPGRWGESESQEAQAERQGYRHKMMGPGEREGYSDRTPRFRGRPQAAGPIRSKASWEVEEQPQFRKGNSFTRESVMMEESRMRAARQPPGASAEKPFTKTQDRVVSEAQKAPLSAPVRKEDLKQDVSQTTLTSVYSKPALPLAAAAVALATGATTSKIIAEPAPKTNDEKLNIQDEKAPMKQSRMVTYQSAITTLPGTEVIEEKTKKATVEDPIKSAKAKATAEPATEKAKSQVVIPAAASQETSKLPTGAVSAAPVITKSTIQEAKTEKKQTQIIDPIKPAAVKPLSKKEATKLKAQSDITVSPVQETPKPLSDSATISSTITKPANKDVKENEATNGIALDATKPAEIKAKPEPARLQDKPKVVVIMAASQETSKPNTPTATPVPVVPKPEKDFKEKKSNKVSVDPAQSSAGKAVSEKPNDEVKAEAALTLGTAQDEGPARVTEPLKVEVKKEKNEGTKVDDGSIKPTEVKTPVEPQIKHEKAKKTSEVSVTQDTTQHQPQSTTRESVITTDSVVKTSKVEVTQVPVDSQVTVVSQLVKPKSDEMPPKTTTVVESSVIEVKTSVSTKPVPEPSAEDVKTIRTTEVITKQEKRDVKVVPIVKKEEKTGQEASEVSVQGPALEQKDLSSASVSKKAAPEVVMETKQSAEASSKSKKKKKKSPGEISKSSNDEGPHGSKLEKEEITCPDTPPEEVDEIPSQPTLLLTSAPPQVTALKTEKASLEKENKTQSKKDVSVEEIKAVPKQTDGKLKISIPKKTEGQSDSEVTALPVEQISAATQEKLPHNATIKEQTKGGSVQKSTQGPSSAVGKPDVKLTHTELMKSEETTVTKVETVIVQKITQVENVQASPKPVEKSPATVPEPQKLTSEIKSPVSAGKAAEEASKGKKKGKGKKQAQAQAAADGITAESVRLPEAKTLQPADSTSSSKSTVKDSPVTASELTENVSPKMTPERMCSEETKQAAAVLSEAPADKREVESAPLFAEKIKREVPKPKTSLTAREAHAAGELASAAPALTAEAAVAQAQANPLAQREEPPKVAQHSASQSVERSTEKRLSVSEALKQEEEKKKDLEEDTPSVSATPAAAQPDQPHLGDICESESPDIDAMKRKIVVVEEIVEVKQIVSPQAAGGQSPPPTVIPEEEGEELDLDVLEALAIERALLSGVEGTTVYGASPDPEWDHSLEEPEEKTWPNFNEGVFECINLLPAFSYPLCLHVT